MAMQPHMPVTRHGAGTEEHPRRPWPVSDLLLALLIVVVIGTGIAYLLKPDTLPISQVRIEGEFRQLSAGSLEQLVRMRLTGGFFSVDVRVLREALLSDPWVREVWVQRVWPDGLRVSVREQVAVARWSDDGLLNAAGEYFAPAPETFPPGLPRLDGPPGSQGRMLKRLRQAQEVLAPLGLKPARIRLSDRRAWTIELNDGLEVILGRADFDLRLERFAQLVPAALGERLREAGQVDMRYTNGFAVRWRGGAATAADGEAVSSWANDPTRT